MAGLPKSTDLPLLEYSSKHHAFLFMRWKSESDQTRLEPSKKLINLDSIWEGGIADDFLDGNPKTYKESQNFRSHILSACYECDTRAWRKDCTSSTRPNLRPWHTTPRQKYYELTFLRKHGENQTTRRRTSSLGGPKNAHESSSMESQYGDFPKAKWLNIQIKFQATRVLVTR